MDPNKDYYEILGVDPNADQDEIKEAYRELAKEYHPDRSDEEGAEEKFKEIQEANNVLGDRDKRREYDMHRSGPSVGGSGRNPFTTGGGFSNVEERINEMRQAFQEHVGSDFGNRHTKHRTDPKKSPDYETETEITLSEIARGKSTTVKSPKAETVEVEIPASIKDNQLVRVPGYGYDLSGVPRGDLIVRVRIKNDTEFTRDGLDLYKKVPVNPFECMLGTEVEQTDIFGDTIRFDIPEMTSDGETFRIPGRGMPSGNGVRGDMFFRVDHELQGDLTKRQRELLESLAELERIKAENSQN